MTDEEFVQRKSPTSLTTDDGCFEFMSPKTQMSSLSPAEMEIQPPALLSDDSSATWDWGDLLDFAADDRLLVSFDPVLPPIPTLPPGESEPYPSPEESGSGSGSDRVRKRDPRLICPNFLEAVVPCSCPELDQKLEEAELPKKKRVRGGSSVARCQVPGCEADISELKGYHKRHRVCLGCANASSVVLHGDNKRYCQQCGKFHVLPDFDEGKRSCRRKLERHNNMRKRKTGDKGGVAMKLQQVVTQNDKSVIHVEDGKGTKLDRAIFDFSWKRKLILLARHIILKEIRHALVTRELNKRLRLDLKMGIFLPRDLYPLPIASTQTILSLLQLWVKLNQMKG